MNGASPQDLERHATTHREFNKSDRPRITWQSRLEDAVQFVFAAPLFDKRTSHNANTPVPYPVHPWIQRAVEDDHTIVPHLKRPSIFSYEDGVLKTVEDSGLGELRRGDIIWMSFTVTYAVGRKDCS